MRHAAAWTRALPLLAQVARRGRADHGPFVERVHRMLLSQPGHAALRDALLTADRVGARAAVRVLVSEADLDPEPLLAAGDPIVRLLLLRRLQAGETERPVPILERLARDRFPPIAAGALDLLARADIALAEPLLRGALLSMRGMLRSTAQFHLSAMGEDVEALYVERLIGERLIGERLIGERLIVERLIVENMEARVVAPALAGYAETSTSPDPDLVRLYLRHRTARVRRAALRALVRADRSDVTTFVGALADDSPGVTKTALAALWRRPRSVAVQDLARLATDPREHVQRAAARLSGLRQYRVQRGFRPVWDAPDP